MQWNHHKNTFSYVFCESHFQVFIRIDFSSRGSSERNIICAAFINKNYFQIKDIFVIFLKQCDL